MEGEKLTKYNIMFHLSTEGFEKEKVFSSFLSVFAVFYAEREAVKNLWEEGNFQGEWGISAKMPVFSEKTG